MMLKSSAGNKSVQGIKPFSVKLAMTLTKKSGHAQKRTRVSESGLFLVLLASLLVERAISRVSAV